VTLLARQGHFAGDPPRWAEVMRLTIAVNASFFNAHRML
jgi:hypothetical protein